MTEFEQTVIPKSTGIIEASVIQEISGAKIEQKLLELAQIGGTVEKVGGGIPVTRLAFSPEDLMARVFLEKDMRDAGMDVSYFPWGLIGLYQGESPTLPAIAMMSHFDTVPKGGAYDGTVGIISAIEIVRILHRKRLHFAHPMMIISLTAEESSRYKIALVGSKMAFDGLTLEELRTSRTGDLSIEESLIKYGFNPKNITQPTLYPGNIAAVIELHIEQNNSLVAHSKDLGIVEVISASDRREVVIGHTLTPDIDEYTNAEYLQISVVGKADHSGATPMGREHRADGLLPMADILIRLSQLQKILRANNKDINIYVGGIIIEEQALNKIPGRTSCDIKITGSNAREVRQLAKTLYSEQQDNEGLTYIQIRNKYYQKPPSVFTEAPIHTLSIQPNDQSAEHRIFYKPEEILPFQLLAAQIIRAVNATANKHRNKRIVGTVGTSNMKGGQIRLGVDIRGADEDNMQKVWKDVEEKIDRMNKDNTPYDINKLPTSADPAKMDQHLINLTKQVIEDHKIGSYEVTFSPATHDSQITARKGIPTLMIFIPSRNGGVSHSPQEYSTPDDLEKGAKALAALVIRLASEK